MIRYLWATAPRMWIYVLGISATIVLFEAWLARSYAFYDRPDLVSFAITFDFVLAIPLLYFVFVIRKAHVSWVTVVPIFLLFTFLAGIVLPRENQYYLNLFRKI